MTRACSKFAESRSAYVDGALGDADRERLLKHLTGCAECRHEVEDLRSVRDMLRPSVLASGVSPASTDFSHRLVSIAGAEAHAPLWTRPFRRTCPGSLPSARRALRVRVATAAVALGTIAAAFAGIGAVAAPQLDLPELADPLPDARAEFSAILAQLPLSNDAVNAVMMAAGADLSSSVAPVPAERPASGTGTPLDSTEAMAALQRGQSAATGVAYSGTQQVIAHGHNDGVGRHNDRVAEDFIGADVGIRFDPNKGSELTVQGSGGGSSVQGFLPAPVAGRTATDDLLPLLARNYTLSGVGGVEMLGRSATLVEGRRGAGGLIAGRWWIDDESGLLLRQENYDETGKLSLSAGFTSVVIGGSGAVTNHLPPALSVPTTTSALTLSSAGELANSGWFCRDTLGDQSLVRLRSDGADPGIVHMVYSDGLNTTSVFETRGRLTEPPPGSAWDEDLGAYVSDGLPALATWQSAGTVFTVVTDGTDGLLADAVDSLPHQPPDSRTTMDRVQAGWTRIVDRVIG